ncbi:MAG: hypothetical protein PHP17_03785 [Candidatus Omnitrophica bacterium]|nr:hypothetical protein [Candidatus Omnitrophota bacterium]
MIRKVFFCVLAVLCFLNCGNVFAYQFRDYTWGTPRKVIEENLLKGKMNFSKEQYAVYYNENIFGSDCKVVFLFTLSGELLCAVNLIWNNTDIGPKLKDELVKKYGDPVKLNAYTEEYTWPGTSDYDKLNLDYNYGDTRLEYYGGDYFKEYQKNMADLFSAKNKYGANNYPRQPHIIMELDGGRPYGYRRR